MGLVNWLVAFGKWLLEPIAYKPFQSKNEQMRLLITKPKEVKK